MLDRSESRAYREGVQAFQQGLVVDANPYPPISGASAERGAWFTGWYDEKHAQQFPAETFGEWPRG